MRRFIGKNKSPRDKANIEYISEEQSSPFELAFGVKLDSNTRYYFSYLCVFPIPIK